MSIDTQSGRYCLPCSIDILWRNGDILAALDGLPAQARVQGQPLTELLCGYHRYQFLHIPLPKPMVGANGRVLRYPDGTPAQVDAGYFPRAQTGLHYHFAQDDLLEMLERMERGLRLLDAARRRARLIEVICDEPTVLLPTAQELLSNAHLHAQIYDFLAGERLRIPGDTASDAANLPPPLVPPTTWRLADLDFDTNRDDPNDRISGEE